MLPEITLSPCVGILHPAKLTHSVKHFTSQWCSCCWDEVDCWLHALPLKEWAPHFSLHLSQCICPWPRGANHCSQVRSLPHIYRLDIWKSSSRGDPKPQGFREANSSLSIWPCHQTVLGSNPEPVARYWGYLENYLNFLEPNIFHLWYGHDVSPQEMLWGHWEEETPCTGPGVKVGLLLLELVLGLVLPFRSR